eukprot:g5278.t1
MRNSGELLLSYTMTIYRIETRVRIVEKNGVKERVTETVRVPRLLRKYRRKKLTDLMITNATGKKLSAENLLDALDKPTIVLISSDGNKPGRLTATNLDVGPVSTDTTAPVADVPTGELPEVPGYRVLHEIARGGMGRVLAAIDLGLDRDVALKILLPRASSDRFVRESKITAQLPHPGIPPVHALGTLADGSPFLAMKLIAGRTLAEEMKTADRSWLVQAVTQVCQAVGFAHARGVIHRDLKPSNVMVGEFGEVHVMDWGLAKFLTDREVAGDGSTVSANPTQFTLDTDAGRDASADVSADQSTVQCAAGEATDEATRAGEVMGTPAYMAPEQARGEAADARSDVFALGGILCAILTGEPPFRGKSPLDVIRHAAAADLADAEERLASCGADLELVTLCRRCLSPAPTDRPADGQAVADALTTYHNGVQQRLESAERKRAVAAAREVEQRKRRRVLLLAAVAVFGILLAGGSAAGWQWWRAEKALETVTEEKRLTTAALDDLTESRNRNLATLRKVTDGLVSERMQRRKKLTDADRAFIQGLLPMWQELASSHDDTRVGRAIRAEGHFQVAFLQEQLGDRDDAGREFRVALELWEKLTAEFSDVAEYRKELAHTHNSLGLLLRDLGKHSDAEKHYRAALDIKEALADDFPDNAEYRQDLAGAQNNLGRLFARLGRMKAAAEQYRQSLYQRQKLVADFPKSHEYRRDEAESHNNLGILLWGLKKRKEAEDAFLRALSVRKQLAADFPDIVEYRQLLSHSHNNLGNLFWFQKKFAESEKQFRIALGIKQKLMDEFPAIPVYSQSLANAHNSLGNTLAKSGKQAEAEKQYRAALAVNQQLVRQHPAVPEYRRDLASSHNALGSLFTSLGKPIEAEKQLQIGLTLRQKLATEFPSVPVYRRDVSSSYYNLACLFATIKEKDGPAQQTNADRAMTMLHKAVEAGWNDGKTTAANPDFKSLRDREDFQALLAALGGGGAGRE